MKTIKNREYSYNHTKQRMLERFNIHINKRDYNKLCSLISSRTIVMRESVTQEVHIIEWKNQTFTVVFNTEKSCITTVLPKRQ